MRNQFFLNFNDHNVSENNFHSILVFSDKDSKNLPMWVRSNLGVPKEDISAMNETFFFKDLKELFSNHQRVI